MSKRDFNWYRAKGYVPLCFRSIARVISFFLTIAFSTGGSGVEVPAMSPEPLAYVKGLIQQKEAELRRLEAGEVGVGGYALFGAKPPKELLSGNVLDDQYYQSSSRIEVLRNQLSGLRLLRAYYEKEKQTFDGGVQKVLTADEVSLRDAGVYEYTYRNWKRANQGARPTMRLSSNVNGIRNTRGRMYIFFDVKALADKPYNVEKVELQLHRYEGMANATNVNMHRVVEPWNEGKGTYHSGQNEPTAPTGVISWMQQPKWDANTVWSTQAVRHLKEAYPVRWGITNLVKAWLAGEFPNYGVVLVGEGEGRASYAHGFFTSEYKEKAQRPKITVKKKEGSESTTGGDPGTTEETTPVAKAHRQYIAAYNRLTQLMSQGKGDSPEAQKAYEEYKRAKANYEKLIRR